MSDQNRCNHITSEEILHGVSPSRRLCTCEDEHHSQLQLPHISLCANALHERLSNEELFLVRLLSYQRDHERRIKETLAARVDKLLQTIPIDLLSYQWLHKCTLSGEIRMYLVEHLLPALVMGLEYILREADHRGLCKTAESAEDSGERTVLILPTDVNFNPINRLAEYLMRNNPRYENITGGICPTPYTISMQQIAKLLQQDLFLQSDTVLAKYTASSERRKCELEDTKEEEERDLDEKKRRIEPIFDCFRLEGKDTINAIIVQKSMQAYLRIVMGMPNDLSLIERPILHVDYVDEEVGDYTRAEFLTYVMVYVRPLSMVAFEAFTKHMQRCGREYREQVKRNLKVDHVAEVNVSCDRDAEGAVAVGKKYLDEKFDGFARECNAEMQQHLVFPHEWRIHEYHLRHSKFDPWDKSVEILPYKCSVGFKDVRPRDTLPESSRVRQDDEED
ncbi:hypothetical protein Aperf_G00000024598 [Anoplocephala perfoliata]